MTLDPLLSRGKSMTVTSRLHADIERVLVAMILGVVIGFAARWLLGPSVRIVECPHALSESLDCVVAGEGTEWIHLEDGVVVGIMR